LLNNNKVFLDIAEYSRWKSVRLYCKCYFCLRLHLSYSYWYIESYRHWYYWYIEISILFEYL